MLRLATDEQMTETKATKTAAPDRNGKRGTVWEIDDRYGRAMARRIVDANGRSTDFALVHGWDGAAGEWSPIRPVSDRYHPVGTAQLIDTAIERFGEKVPLLDEIRKLERFGTSARVTIPIDRPFDVGRAFDEGHPWTQHGIGGRKLPDTLYPSIEVRNAYDATSSISVTVGLWRLICSNGAKVMVSGFKTRAIHTRHEVVRAIEETAAKDFSGLADYVKALSVRKLDAESIKRITDKLPAKRQDEFREYVKLGGNSAWAAMNGISYLQTHEYSLTRGRQLEPLAAMVMRLAA